MKQPGICSVAQSRRQQGGFRCRLPSRTGTAPRSCAPAARSTSAMAACPRRRATVSGQLPRGVALLQHAGQQRQLRGHCLQAL